jgi:hypothetical protein
MRTLYRSMRPHLLFILLFFVTVGLVGHVITRNQGPHNGVVKRVDNYCIELKNVERKLFAYLLDAKLKAIPVKDITAEALFSFPDSTSMSISLKQDVDNAFTCEAPSDFYACKISFNRQGKMISAIFSNTIRVVRK